MKLRVRIDFETGMATLSIDDGRKKRMPMDLVHEIIVCLLEDHEQSIKKIMGKWWHSERSLGITSASFVLDPDKSEQEDNKEGDESFVFQHVGTDLWKYNESGEVTEKIELENQKLTTLRFKWKRTYVKVDKSKQGGLRKDGWKNYRQCFALFESGASNKEVIEATGLSKRTVQRHRRFYAKSLRDSQSWNR